MVIHIEKADNGVIVVSSSEDEQITYDVKTSSAFPADVAQSIGEILSKEILYALNEREELAVAFEFNLKRATPKIWKSIE